MTEVPALRLAEIADRPDRSPNAPRRCCTNWAASCPSTPPGWRWPTRERRLHLPGEHRTGPADARVPQRAKAAHDIVVDRHQLRPPAHEPLGPAVPSQTSPHLDRASSPPGITEGLERRAVLPSRAPRRLPDRALRQPEAPDGGRATPVGAAQPDSRSRSRPDAVAAQRRTPGPGRRGRRGGLQETAALRRFPGWPTTRCSPEAPPSWAPPARPSGPGTCTRPSCGREVAGTRRRPCPRDRPDGRGRRVVRACAE
jgi:hypothetical protein